MDKIRAYVESALQNVRQTQEVMDLKEELIGNLTEKYEDCLAQGMSEAAAYGKAIEGVGDLSELLGNVTGSAANVLSEKEANQRARFTSLAAGLCLLAPGCLLLFIIGFHSVGLGLFSMFLCFGISGGLALYVFMTRPRGMASQLAETQRQAAMEKLSSITSAPVVRAVVFKNQKEKAAQLSLGVAYWMIVLAVYFLLSFLLSIWAYSWLIFILALAVQQIAKAVYYLKSGK